MGTVSAASPLTRPDSVGVRERRVDSFSIRGISICVTPIISSCSSLPAPQRPTTQFSLFTGFKRHSLNLPLAAAQLPGLVQVLSTLTHVDNTVFVSVLCAASTPLIKSSLKYFCFVSLVLLGRPQTCIVGTGGRTIL